jgi:hypothetical protein
MTLKSYLWGMRFSAILAFTAWALVLFYTDPTKGGVLIKFVFYFTFFLLLSAIFILMLSWAKRKVVKEGGTFSDLGISFREGILLAFLAIALLVLQSFRILVWWDGLLVVAGIFLVELYFLTK